MASLREAKKRATRHAIADSAARLVLAEGAEKLTVARIAEVAGVSPRTFHNYFTSASDALLFFTASVLESFSENLDELYPESDINEFFEHLVSDVLESEDENLHSIATLVAIGESLEGLSHTAEERQRYESCAEDILKSFSTRMADFSEREMRVILTAHGAAARLALMEINAAEKEGRALSIEEKKQIVSECLAALKKIS
ncbi:MAG: TetR/AcrR family transcriptional regulator [Corynebacterium striatum]|uniref:TetR/AcrR family transcriptional regulator n=1 Tax=Corynebacterium sp. c25Ua_89 TaxID=3032356 RepID=UPI00290133AB|nr:TetR/AcrR family transcriptional regulator [Corynebacterium striatum]